jgi:hypothetical protein
MKKDIHTWSGLSNVGYITFKDLFEEMKKEVDKYEELGMLDELMNQKVLLNLYDRQGNILEGSATWFVGWLEGGDVLVTGILTDIF